MPFLRASTELQPDSTDRLSFIGIVVVLIGHALNIVMCFLSVVVHGVRLNVLEFSGQAGLEWTGVAYEPFKVNDKIDKIVFN